MKRRSTHFNLWIIVTVITVTINYAFAAAVTSQDTTLVLRKSKSAKTSYLKSGLPFALPPIKPGVVSTAKVNVSRPDDKLLSNVQVFPNPAPASEPLNLRYAVSRNTNVTIKIVDVLGNDVLTIFSQRVETGDQKFTYMLNNKLSRGFYFVRIIAGTESTIKRLSVL